MYHPHTIKAEISFTCLQEDQYAKDNRQIAPRSKNKMKYLKRVSIYNSYNQKALEKWFTRVELMGQKKVDFVVIVMRHGTMVIIAKKNTFDD